MEKSMLFERLRELGTDVEGALERFVGDPDFYIRYLRRLPLDPNYQKMQESLAAGNFGELLSSSHAMKGLTGNLGMNYMYERLCLMVDDLRNNRYDRLETLNEEFRINYERVCHLLLEE